MANEKNNEKVNENVEKANANETNVKNDSLNNLSSLEYDAFEYRRNRDENLEYHNEDDAVVFKTPLFVQRIAGGKAEDSERVYYNYAVGYRVKINGKEISQTVPLAPTEKRADIYDLLDAIFGESDRVPLYISRVARTNTVNGFTRTTYSYTPQVRAEDEIGDEFLCSLAASGQGGRAKFTNLVNKFKSMGVVE